MDIIASRFRVDRWLGEGSLGELYLVEQQGTSLQNTLRILPGAPAGNPPPAALVTRNATRIRHPNVAQVHEVGKTPDGQMYVLMDRAAGTLLAEIAARGAVPLRWAVEITRQMIAGIRAAHEAGVIHGTLTPESVVIGSTEDDTLTVRILDLGLETLFHIQGGVPDPRYAAPEALAGAAPDERSDVYSLGAVAYHLMTGTPIGTPDPNAIPEALGSVLAEATAKNPEDRFQTVALFGEALGHAWGEPVTTTETTEKTEKTERTERTEAPSTVAPAVARRKLELAGLAVAAVALLLVWVNRPAQKAADLATPTHPLRVAPEDEKSGTQWVKPPTPAPAQSATAGVSKPAQRRITSPTLLPGQGYKAGLVREEAPPAEVEPSNEAAPPNDAEAPADAAPEAPPTVTPTAEPSPAPAVAAAPTAEAAMSEARAAAATAINSYASAIEANDVDAIRRVYPGLTDQERSAWQEFFAAARDLKAQLSIKDVEVKDGLTEAQVTGVYEYANRSLNRVERKPVSFRATLTRGPDGWRLSEVR